MLQHFEYGDRIKRGIAKGQMANTALDAVGVYTMQSGRTQIGADHKRELDCHPVSNGALATAYVQYRRSLLWY